MLLKHFNMSATETVLHACCDVYAKICKCLCHCQHDCECANKCSQQDCLSVMERHIKNLSSSISFVTKQKVHNVSKHDAIKLRLALLDYRAELGTRTKECSLLTGLDITTGFSRSLIEDIVNNLPYIKDKEFLEENFAFFSEDHVQKTWEVLNSVLLASDSDNEEDTSSIFEPRAANSSDSDAGSEFSWSSENSVQQQICYAILSSESSSSESS